MLNKQTLAEMAEYAALHNAGIAHDDIIEKMNLSGSTARAFRIVLMKGGVIRHQIRKVKRGEGIDTAIRRDRYADMHRRGTLSHAKIAAELGVSVRTATRYRTDLIRAKRITPRSPGDRRY